MAFGELDPGTAKAFDKLEDKLDDIDDLISKDFFRIISRDPLFDRKEFKQMQKEFRDFVDSFQTMHRGFADTIVANSKNAEDNKLLRTFLDKRKKK
ncbi:MAG: hypothetical protein COA52_00690 [Hyphomicrobiales bacterium]|nr:MAG: hypothetical protein COA52_00690 [Hyphomicrobiales bacterium]